MSEEKQPPRFSKAFELLANFVKEKEEEKVERA